MEFRTLPLAPCCSNSSSSKTTLPSEASGCENGGGALKDCEQEVTSPSPTLIPHHINGTYSTAAASFEADIPPSRPSGSLDSGKAFIRKNRRPPRASSSFSSSLRQRGARVDIRRRIPLGFRGRCGENDIHNLALPLGMSIAAVIAQVLDRQDAAGDRISADHLSMICMSAVKESIESVFADRFDSFMRNFEKSFGSTLKTLRLLNEASLDVQQDSLCTSYARDHVSEASPAPGTHELPADIEEIGEDMQLNPMNHHLILHGQIDRELSNVSQSRSGSGYSQSALSTFEKSVMEQARSNDLKAFEIALVMKKLQLKESQLALSSDANLLERFKISLGISRASFREEKLKNQLQDTRHAELLKKCIDCLVAGLLIMSLCLIYGAYIFSYKRISEATVSCNSPSKASKSWWVPNPMASLSSGLHMLRCHVLVVSRMLFGVLIILALAYSLLQRSSSSQQTMPVTFILLLLGVACGIAGKLCVDTLGGSGYLWLLYWEAICLVHFFANVFTSALFHVLHGPVSVSQGIIKARLPYWIRRVAFYSTVLLFLPVLCGLIPFAAPRDWIQHFSSLTTDKLFDPMFRD